MRKIFGLLVLFCLVSSAQADGLITQPGYFYNGVGVTLTLTGALTYGGVTLNSAVSGGGSMVLASSPVILTPVIATLRGGTATSTAMIIESTSGVGATDSIAFKTGSQSTFMSADTNGLISVPKIGSDITHTDSSICQDTTTHALYSGSGTLGVCLGTSSIRYKRKDTIRPITDGIAQIMELKPDNYFYQVGYGDQGKREQYGFMAEDIVKVLPKLVGLDERGKPNSVDMLGMMPILVKAIQQLERRVAYLEKHQVRK